jgi:putative hydrolase
VSIDPPSVSTLRNADLSQLLAAAASEASGHLAQALRRASRRALEWPEEAADLVAAGRSLTELNGIGPRLEETLTRWIDDPPPVPDPGPARSRFLTLAEVRAALTGAPGLHAPRGDLQMHTTWSDGSASVAEMVAVAGERGYEFIAITDHTKSLKIAGGMDEETLAAQLTELERVEEEAGPGAPAILRSVELNLDVEGRGDMDPAALARLDLVLGSFHSALREKSDQTERYLAALRNPDVHVLGHPRGRMYGRRVGLVAEWDRVFAEAARLGKAVEVDAFPDRQDLDVELLRRAHRAGALVSIGSDSHHPSQLRYLEYGQGAAALAGVPPERILNFWPASQLRAWATGLRAGMGAEAVPPGV